MTKKVRNKNSKKGRGSEKNIWLKESTCDPKPRQQTKKQEQ